jgi:hypothetical protein
VSGCRPRAQGPCQKNVKLADGATQEKNAGWARYYFPLEAFGCLGAITPGDLNRLHWENQGAGTASLCVKDLRILPKDDKP